MGKPEALRLADALEAYWAGANGHDRERQAAAELRRLHAENERLSATVKAREDEILTHSGAFYEATRLLSEEREKNERLLEACKAYDQWADKTFCYDRVLRPIRAQIRAAIAAVEGEKK